MPNFALEAQLLQIFPPAVRANSDCPAFALTESKPDHACHEDGGGSGENAGIDEREQQKAKQAGRTRGRIKRIASTP